ncbi:hypothetical protein CHUAL_007620 [Chamberlinius hualienensis]
MAADYNLIWLCFVLILLLFIAYWYLSGPKNLPPGITGLPIVGYLPFMGSRLTVILNDYSTIQEAFVKNGYIFAGRPIDNVLKESSIDNFGLVTNDGEYWKEHRRFILRHLKNNGLGKTSLEPFILGEIHQFLKEFEKHAGKICDIKKLLMNSIVNNISIMVTGKRFDYDDPAVHKFRAAVNLNDNDILMFNLAAIFPWISNKKLKAKCLDLRNYIQSTIDAASRILDVVINEYEDGLQGTYIHAYLTERNSRLNVKGNDDIFTETGLYHISRDLLVAGSDTTSGTLLFSLLYMTLNPEIQEKVQNEIDSVIGRERQPSYNDRFNMPYTEAVILEVHRIVSLVPLSVPHRNVKDVVIGDYVIPQNAIIIPNLYAVHHDPNIWGDPETFRPERFLGPDGKLINTEYVLPFSVGKRACVGEPLARMELFLYFVSLLQQFTFIPPDGKMPILDCYSGISTRPKVKTICAISRR